MQAGMSFAATGSPTIQSGVSISAATGLVPRWAISTSTVTTFETVFIRDATQASSTNLATEVYSSTLHSMVHHNATSKSSPLPGDHPTTARWGTADAIMRSIDTAHPTQAESVLTTSLSENKASKTFHSSPATSIPPKPSGDLFGHNIFGPPPSVMSCLYAEAGSSPIRTGEPTPTPELENHKAREHAALHIADILPLNKLLKEDALKKHQIFGAFFITLNISEDAISLAHVHDLDRIVVVNKPGQVADGQPSAGGTSSATPHPTSTIHSPEVNVPPVSATPAVPTTSSSIALVTSSTSSTESLSKSTSSKLVLPLTTSTLQTSTESSSRIQSTSSTMASADASKMSATPNASTSTVTMITTVYPEDATVTPQGPQRQASLPTATTVGGFCSPETTVRQHTMGEGSMASIQENTVIIPKTHRGNSCAPVSTTTIPHSEGTAIATEDANTGSITSKRVIPTVSDHPGSFFTTHMPVPTS
ncbi:hypothetical protein KC343_g9057 [Hortaea werneckii]|uniref:Uncharacterized protein n=1 Tax=Hortaea werneckii TaxID=91943 RepID=A0A3M7CYM6_HORWE|nr:hypothetical protein KC352_g16137 [Hortaea werneckii]KAI7566073.1 hypothetical protein KC317_g5911 [Hortaea werneckii]KAI7613810.1 hypothetical protein KC346_g7208 [Hortaea werneckii]KAI7618559.1 hypothetical protein KC343_g9057 [Hortaea werneckii]KAI7661949.1 hypothetical protein KC319_g8270 [Hortaea werneckii]